ncbi:DUF7332 family protein [Halalkalicoccus subterraneus]|uniref:DUF7332 family protein n=1 Tax=Halalkalicoccus subterraneus TaxID=2675002 RepID=UPI000EFD5E2D|nr:hypothetical protein [Halalkalicoccus subterraneus]
MNVPPLVWVVTAIVVSASLIGVAGASMVSEPADRCFPDSGYEFSVGNETRVDLTLHLSLLTNLGDPGGLGVELLGSTTDTDIVSLRTGVLFDGVESAGGFLSNPFESFSVVFEYALQLPMLGEDVRYESDDAPVSGPIGTAGC